MSEHRQWLRDNAYGMKFAVSKNGKFVDTYKDTNYTEDFYNENINQVQINPRTVVLEYDCKPEDAWTYIEKTKELLRKEKIGFEVYNHKGRSPHIHIQAEGPLTKEQKEFFLKKYASHESVDLSLANLNHMIAVPYAKHWKYNSIKELIDENIGGKIQILDLPAFVEKQSLDENNPKKERIIEILNNHGKKIDKSGKLTCMFHDDKNPSMLLNNTNAYCFAEGKVFSFERIAKYYGEELKENQIKNLTPELQEEIKLSINPIYYDRAGLWWLWDPLLLAWRRSDETDILNMVSRCVKSDLDLLNAKLKNEILLLLRLHGRINQPKVAPLSWIQFKNGIVDLNTIKGEGEIFELIKPSPEYFMMNPIPWEISNSSDTPIIDKLFNDWMQPDIDFIDTLYEIISYCMLRDYPINRIFCFHGPGSNGKTTFINLLKIFIGDGNFSSTRLSTLLNNRFELQKLHKKLIATISETTFREIENSDVIKDLSGGDIISFEYKYAIDAVSEKNYAKLIISTNNLPPTSDKSQGYYRRWLIIDFLNKFTEKRDILSEIPESEYNNLSRKCILKLKELLAKREFAHEGTIEERQRRYEDRSDPFEKFLREFTIEDYDGYIWKKTFIEKLNPWCREKGFRELSEKTVAQKMREKGIKEEQRSASWMNDGRGGRGRCWVGISWNDQLNDNTDFKSTLSIKKEEDSKLFIEEITF